MRIKDVLFARISLFSSEYDYCFVIGQHVKRNFDLGTRGNGT